MQLTNLLKYRKVQLQRNLISTTIYFPDDTKYVIIIALLKPFFNYTTILCDVVTLLLFGSFGEHSGDDSVFQYMSCGECA